MIALIAYVVTRLSDTATTWLALARHCKELNPVVLWIFRLCGGWRQGLVVIALFWVAVGLAAHAAGGIYRRGLWIVALYWLVATANNLRALRRIR